MKLCRPQKDLRKKYADGHFAMASVKFARELANFFSDRYVILSFLSRVPLSLPISKKQTAILIHLGCKVMLLNHDFSSEPDISLFYLSMQRALKKMVK